jgi:outer membrane protein OmpA-like peptidoglycan-associated protein
MLTKHHLQLTLGSILSVSLLLGCTTDPYTGEQKASKAAIGAVTGALVGAAVSSDSDRRKGALIGAAVGGGAGYYMDVQEKKLRDQLQGTGVSVSRDGSNIVLNMPGNLTFSTNSSEISPSFFSVLNSVVIVFKEYPKTAVRVAGHTDSVGDESYNLTLSQKRAQSVATYLTSQGIVPSRLQVIGYGESMPIASNESQTGRSQNRRVELVIVPTEA